MKRKTSLNQTKTNIHKQNQEFTFLDHLEELRTRFLVFIFLFFINSLIAYFFKDKLFNVVTSPLNEPLYYTTPAGGFSFTISLCLIFGFITTIPVLIYQLISFIKPAFPNKINQIAKYILFSIILVLAGILFAYYVCIPAALHFLKNFNESEINALITTDSYLNFIGRYFLGFSLVFQLPIIIWIINKIQKLSFVSLLKFEKWLIVLSFVLAAIFTPTPDFINQSIMALPIIFLYQISVLLIAIENRHR